MLDSVTVVGTTPSAAVPPTTAASAASSDPRRDLQRLVRSTPVRMIAFGVVLIVAFVATGLVTSVTVSDRARTLDTLLVRTEPLANSAQNLYGALSVADAAASTAFLAGGLEPQETRDRYTRAIGDAGAELIRASNGLGDSDDDARTVLMEIAAGLPVYTGLVETARTNNRVGNPVGAAYLGEASNQMQTVLLPRAERLYTEQSARVATDQERFIRPPLFAIALVVLCLVLLVLAQIFLAGRTNRTFNWGFLGATATMTVLLGWMLVGGIVSSTATDRALDRGVAPLQSLTSGFILAQQARADETLDLVRRGSSRGYDAEFTTNTDKLTTLFADDPDISATLTAWKASHARIADALDTGDFATAVLITTGSGVQDSSTQFRALDSKLVDGIEQARIELRGNVIRAKSALAGMASGAVALTIVAAAAVAAGIAPRLREYL